MEYIQALFDFILHIDEHLINLTEQYGIWVYAILFLIIFIETGIVIWPWLPGDSLLFTAGALAAIGSLNLYILIPLLFIAAVLGDTCNYFIGKYFGDRIVNLKFRGKLILKKEHLDKTHTFYEKHGPRTIILARFVPIVRTIAPFVAGIGKMTYRKFLTYNIVGAAIWVAPVSFLGYIFGQNEFVKHNFEFVVLGIIFISLIPIFVEIIRVWSKKIKTDS
ncbi:MAG: DedA family protein [Fimbriimonadaceae bacterium]|nr:DedA family protein [Chitinophagales bacterium]